MTNHELTLPQTFIFLKAHLPMNSKTLFLSEKEEDFEGFLTCVSASDVTTFKIIQWHFQTDLNSHER